MQTVKIKTTPLLIKTIEAFEGGARVVIHEGGSRSGKTWSIFLFFILKALQGEQFRLVIVRRRLTWAKYSLLVDFERIKQQYDIPVEPAINPNRPEQTYTINNATFTFLGTDEPQKLQGSPQEWLWVNEAIEVSKAAFDQLEMRTTKGIVLDYNPSVDVHWVYDLQKRPDTKVFKSTVLDNPFAPEAVVRRILSYEPTPENIANGTADWYLWQVYGLGMPAAPKGAIFSNWDVVDEIPEGAKFLAYGLDFGFANDPTAIVAVYKYNNELYVHEVAYETGLVNVPVYDGQPSIVGILEREGIKSEPIIADSSEPKSIKEIAARGFNIRGATKGQDSIRYGIELLQRYKIHITRSSVNIIREFRNYKWAEKSTGELLDRPIDDFNHAIDALRYVALEKLGQKRGTVRGYDFVIA